MKTLRKSDGTLDAFIQGYFDLIGVNLQDPAMDWGGILALAFSHYEEDEKISAWAAMSKCTSIVINFGER